MSKNIIDIINENTLQINNSLTTTINQNEKYSFKIGDLVCCKRRYSDSYQWLICKPLEITKIWENLELATVKFSDKEAMVIIDDLKPIKFKIGDKVTYYSFDENDEDDNIYIIEDINIHEGFVTYKVTCPKYSRNLTEAFLKLYKPLNITENENRLQENDDPLRRGTDSKRSGVHGKRHKTSIRVKYQCNKARTVKTTGSSIRTKNLLSIVVR